MEAKLFVAALEACFHFGLFPFEMFLQHSLFVVFSSKRSLQKDIKVLAGEENILNVIKPNPFRFLSRLKAESYEQLLIYEPEIIFVLTFKILLVREKQTTNIGQIMSIIELKIEK